jgi:hypothetical protein
VAQPARLTVSKAGPCLLLPLALTSSIDVAIVAAAMNVVKATRHFEDWLAHHTDIVKKDLHTKHLNMKAGVFPFLRATYYRWAQIWPEVCPELSKAPQVLAVGDLHVENFGTWRDIEGRLIWGVNDFDEASPLAYTNDLVRLAVSAHLAVETGHLSLKRKDICDAILEGYLDGLRRGGMPFVLEAQHDWLRQIAQSELRDPVHFWAKMDALPTAKRPVAISAIDAIEHVMPAHNLKYRIAHRVAGLGSLGHARYVALVNWNGGRIAREAKALVSSAANWARGRQGPAEILYQTIISRAVRCPDPFVQLRGRWIVRRLSPHCSRIELTTLQMQKDEMRLLLAMGLETANIHLGIRSARKPVLAHLQKQKSKWLHRVADEMMDLVRADWKTWKSDGYV